MNNTILHKIIFFAFFLCATVVNANPPKEMVVDMLRYQPTIDGNLSEWPPATFKIIRIRPAVKDDKKNTTGKMTVELSAGIYANFIYFAARWPDKTANTDFRPWVWRDNKYKRSKKRDDMFALRFAMAGKYDKSMLTDAEYETDVWVWSAGRSNLAGYATDYKHVISLEPIEDAPEYKTEGGNTVYIDRLKDRGSIAYKTFRPEKNIKSATKVPSIEISENSAGSIADVKAKGVWQSGFWHLEMVRKLDTGYDDDRRLERGQTVLGQIAVFNHANEEHKSISEPIIFVLEK